MSQLILLPINVSIIIHKTQLFSKGQKLIFIIAVQEYYETIIKQNPDGGKS